MPKCCLHKLFLSDATIEKRHDSHGLLRLSMSSNKPLSVDLVYLTAAMLEMCGLCYGMISWSHGWDPRYKELYGYENYSKAVIRSTCYLQG